MLGPHPGNGQETLCYICLGLNKHNMYIILERDNIEELQAFGCFAILLFVCGMYRMP